MIVILYVIIFILAGFFIYNLVIAIQEYNEVKRLSDGGQQNQPTTNDMGQILRDAHQELLDLQQQAENRNQQAKKYKFTFFDKTAKHINKKID